MKQLFMIIAFLSMAHFGFSQNNDQQFYSPSKSPMYRIDSIVTPNLDKITWSYDLHENPTTVWYNWIAGKWKKSYKYEYKFDANGNGVKIVKQ